MFTMLRTVQISFLCFVLVAGISISAEKESIDEILLANGLPVGIFPKGVKGFSVNGETGRFTVYLNESCQAKYETELHYDAVISGTIGYAQIGDLSGISAQELFLWFPVKGIQVDVPSSGLIFFDVGVLRKQYTLSLFETPRDCVAVRNDAEFGGENKVQASMLPLYQVDQTPGRNVV